MTYQQIRDVVHRMRTSHQQLRDSLESPRSRAGDSRTRLMLEALRREEQDLQLVLGLHGINGDEALLDTWLQYVPDDELFETLESIEFTPDLSPDEVMARKLSYDQALISLLQQLVGQTSVPRVQEFFSTLLKNTRSRTAQQVWQIREYQTGGEPPEPEV